MYIHVPVHVTAKHFLKGLQLVVLWNNRNTCIQICILFAILTICMSEKLYRWKGQQIRYNRQGWNQMFHKYVWETIWSYSTGVQCKCLRLFKTKNSMCITLTLVLICWWGDSEHRSLSDMLEEFSNEQSQDDLRVLLSICVDDFLK